MEPRYRRVSISLPEPLFVLLEERRRLIGLSPSKAVRHLLAGLGSSAAPRSLPPPEPRRPPPKEVERQKPKPGKVAHSLQPATAPIDLPRADPATINGMVAALIMLFPELRDDVAKQEGARRNLIRYVELVSRIQRGRREKKNGDTP